jgi:DNA-binding GntR family transcriptional regulator
LGEAVVDSAYLALRGDIVTGQLKPGELLVEMVLADRYGVSRTPIREALRRLEQDGLVQRHGRRLRVRQHRPDEILDIHEVRIVLEEAAARAAAVRRTALELSLLTRVHEAMQRIDERDVAGQVRADWEFHERVWSAGHSGTLIDLLSRLQANLGRYSDGTFTYPGRWNQALAEHGQLLSAIDEHRGDDAAAIVAGHLGVARDLQLRAFAEQDLPDPAR